MRRLLLLFLVLTGLIVAQAPAFACSCARASQRDHFESAEVVFSGTATSSEPVGDPPPPGEPAPNRPVRWTFSVDGEQKGEVGQPARVTTEGDGAACGYGFQNGERYQVYAYRSDGELWTNLCTGTHQLAPGEQPYEPRDRASPSPSPSPSASPSATGPPSASPSPSGSVAPTGAASPSPTADPLPMTGPGGGALAIAAACMLALGVIAGRRRTA